MTGVPAPTLYHRWLGWHAPAMRRALTAFTVGVIVAVVGASVASLLGAGYTLHLAGQQSGASRVLLIGAAVLTVVLSWTVINSAYTLRYADQHFRSKPGGIEFGTEDGLTCSAWSSSQARSTSSPGCSANQGVTALGRCS